MNSYPLLLFVVKDFETIQISTFSPEAGAFPPPAQTILLEREALTLLKMKIGDTLSVQTPSGTKHIEISDLSRPQPRARVAGTDRVWLHHASTLKYLGESGTLQLLKVVVKDQPYDTAAIDKTVGDLTTWLKSQGRTIEEIRIPPPGKHPHQSQMTSILMLLLVFSLMALALSAILTATMIGGLLAQQIRQIGIMKAIGARSTQITSMYLVLIATLGAMAVVLGVPPAIFAARGFATVVGQLLNFTIYSNAIPVWGVCRSFAHGVLIPLLTALNPIMRTSRTHRPRILQRLWRG
ncbi:MAG: FtsX-like permease family protein [Anaerolineales bacterium]|nr:FtsX-like permease family protein [Anaerolineales bacterium]